MPGHEPWIMRLLDEETGVPAKNVRAQQILNRIQDLRMADHVVDPGKEHVAAMAHLALDRGAGPCLIVLELAAKFGNFAFTQHVDGEMVAALAIVRDLALAQQFRHSCPPIFFFPVPGSNQTPSKVSPPSSSVNKC